jgi:hypothetical protein
VFYTIAVLIVRQLFSCGIVNSLFFTFPSFHLKQETSKEQLESLHFKWNDVGLLFTTTTGLFCNVAKRVIDALGSSILSKTEVSEISVISDVTGSLISAMDGLKMVGSTLQLYNKGW